MCTASAFGAVQRERASKPPSHFARSSFFPLFVSLYVGQYLALPLLLQPGFLPCFLSCALYGAALSYYHYCQFLGFSALPFLERTELFLVPVLGVALVTPLAMLLRFNPTAFVLSLYFGPH